MEWMWAAMGAPEDGQGGGTNTTGYLKAFAGSTGSNAIGDFAVFGVGGSETGRTTTNRSNPAGSKLPNELGIYDMSGNVWEWCWDWGADRPSGKVMDYRGADMGVRRVGRGGCWGCNPGNLRPGIRILFHPVGRMSSLGFRVVRPFEALP